MNTCRIFLGTIDPYASPRLSNLHAGRIRSINGNGIVAVTALSSFLCGGRVTYYYLPLYWSGILASLHEVPALWRVSTGGIDLRVRVSNHSVAAKRKCTYRVTLSTSFDQVSTAL